MPINFGLRGQVKLFEKLNDDDIQELFESVETVNVAQDEMLFHTGDAGEAMYIVKSGDMEIFVKDTAGQKIILNIAGAGGSFGELAMLDNKPRSASARALTDAELLVLKRENLAYFFTRKPETALSMMASMSEMVRKSGDIIKTRVSRNVNEEVEVKLSVLEKIADWIAWFSGSMYFLLLNAIWFIVWIGINTLPLGIEQFDPFPFGLLTMIVSLEAIFLSCFVLLSQNRQAEKDRVRADIEYDVNIKAEMEITHLHEKTERLNEIMLERFARLESLLNK